MMLMRDEIRNMILKFIVYMPAFWYHMNEYDIKHSRKYLT